MTSKALSAGCLLLSLGLAACGNDGPSPQIAPDNGTPATPGDQTAPNVVSVAPAGGSTNVSVNTAIVVNFNEAIASNSLSQTTFALTPSVAGSFTVNTAEARFTPSTPLTPAMQYTVALQGIRDAVGNVMSGTYSFSFTTAAALVLNCAAADVLCVDDTAGATQEYSDIPTAVEVVQPGQTVLVHDGTYTGFEIGHSGMPMARITIRAAGSNAIIANSTLTGDGVRLQNASYVTIEGFVIQGNAAVSQPINQRCIAARGALPTSPMLGNELRGNRCTNAGLECFYLSQFGSGVIENNVINGCGRAGGTRNHGIYLANAGSDNTIIRGNSITTTSSAGGQSNGIHMNGDLSIGGDGIISGLTIEANTIYGNTQNGLNMDGVQSSTVRNNLVYDNGRHALRAYDGDGAAGPLNFIIINNTFLALTDGWAIKLTQDGSGHTLFNNILLGTVGSLCVDNPNLTANYNVVDDRLSADDEATIVSLASWRTQTGEDANSLVATAATVFVDGNNKDYRLATVSPARDAGSASVNSISAPGVDIAGLVRPQGARHDIGAFEAATTP